MSEHFQKVFLQTDPFTDILGQERTKRQLKSALLMDRHLIILGPPGIGKTTLAKNVAKLLPTLTLNECQYHCDPKQPLCPDHGRGTGNALLALEHLRKTQTVFVSSRR